MESSVNAELNRRLLVLQLQRRTGTQSKTFIHVELEQVADLKKKHLYNVMHNHQKQVIID